MDDRHFRNKNGKGWLPSSGNKEIKMWNLFDEAKEIEFRGRKLEFIITISDYDSSCLLSVYYVLDTVLSPSHTLSLR